MEQLVEIAYELIAFRTTFKGELFRHGMGIGKIKLVEGKQLIHILAFTIESGLGKGGRERLSLLLWQKGKVVQNGKNGDRYQ